MGNEKWINTEDKIVTCEQVKDGDRLRGAFNDDDY